MTNSKLTTVLRCRGTDKASLLAEDELSPSTVLVRC